MTKHNIFNGVDKKIKIIFLSSSDFGIPSLTKLSENALFDVLALITLPDKPKGRGFKIENSPIKKTALECGIKVLETNNMKDSEFETKVRDAQPDIMVMASFGKIISEFFLRIAPYGVLNIHPSLLPKYRGPSPIQSAILNGDDKTGATIMLTDSKMDHGPIIKISNFQFLISNLGYKKLHNKLAELGADLICEVIPDWISGKIKAEPQDEEMATYTKKIVKEDGLINWNEPAKIIERKIRAYEIWPKAYFFIKKNDNAELRIQVLEAEISEENNGHKVGEFFEMKSGFTVQTGNGILKLIKVKLEGKKEMSGSDFLKGYKKFIIFNF